MKHRCFLISSILILLFIISSIPVTVSQSPEGEPAEIVAEILDTIPPIQVSNWTSIEIRIVDASGINWTKFQEKFNFLAKVVWPVTHPTWRKYLGYTSLRFEPEIISGNSNGWYLDILPSSVTETTTGFQHTIDLRARTDDSAVDYSIVVGIKCTRYDTFSEPMGESFIYVPLKASQANFIEIGKNIDTTKFASPKSMVYFDVSIKNTGYYKDTFLFEIETENNLLGLFEQQVVTMETGETKQLTVGILTPEKTFDPGTPNQVRLYVKSSLNSSRTLIGTFVVMTQGIYISPIVWYILVPIIVLIVVLYFFIIIIKDRKEREIFGKPDKPWLIPEEKTYLEELKKKDKKEYASAKSMMKDEYASSLLWYHSFKDSAKRNMENKEAKGSIFDRLIHPLKKSKLKDEEPVKEEKKTTTKIVKSSEKSTNDANDSKKIETKFEEEPIETTLVSPLKQLKEKILLITKMKQTTKKVDSVEMSQEVRDIPKKDISDDSILDSEEIKYLQEQEKKRKDREEAIKKIEKNQSKQIRKEKR